MTTNQFAKKLAKIHNESGLLYKDMLDQDTLFSLQHSLADFLIYANKDISVTTMTMLEFNNVFNTQK